MGECGVRLFTDCLAGMDDPAKWDWWRKIETRASSLAGGLLFLRPIRPATASKLLFIRAHLCHLTQSLPLFRPSGQPWVALSRIRPDARLWFIFPSNRAAPVRCSKAHPFVGSGLKRHHPPHEASEQRNRKINVSVCGTVSHPLANQ